MAANLTDQVREIYSVTKAVGMPLFNSYILSRTLTNLLIFTLANGDLTRTVKIGAFGEIRELKMTVNSMVAQLRSFAAEVTRVALDVGTEGRLGGTANVEGVQGTWKILTDNFNLMAMNLTQQVREISDVTKAVAEGDLSRKITVQVKGEMLDLKVSRFFPSFFFLFLFVDTDDGRFFSSSPSIKWLIL